MQRLRFFQVEETCPASEIPKMMGRVVADKYFPMELYAPKEPLSGEPSHNTNDIIPSILPKPSPSTDRKDVLQNTKETGLKASLTALFGLELTKDKQELATLETEEVKRYSLNNPREYFNRLMENELYAWDVNELLKSKGRAYLVTGFLTTKGALWTFSNTKANRNAVDASVPVTGLAGATIPIPGFKDPQFGASHSTTYGRQRQMRVLEEEIFAIAYSVVKRSSTLGLQPPHVRHNVVLRNPMRVKGRHHGFGEDSDEEVDNEDDEDGESLLVLDEDEELQNAPFGLEY